jgi:hypothetical protein
MSHLLLRGGDGGRFTAEGMRGRRHLDLRLDDARKRPENIAILL